MAAEVETPGARGVILPPDSSESGPACRKATGFRSYLNEAGGTPLIIVFLVIAIMLPVVRSSFAGADDAAILWMASSGEGTPQFGDSIIRQNTAGGRPLAGVVTQVGFGLAGTIEHLAYVRMVAVVGVVCLGIVLHWNLVRAGVRPGFAALIAVFVSAMPAFQVYGLWAVLFAAPYAALLAGLASMLVVRGADRVRGWRAWEYGAAGGLLLAALWTYQPPAMFFWVFLAVALVGAREEPSRAWRITVAHGAVGAGTLAVAFVSLKAMIRLVGKDTPGAERGTLSFDVIGRLRWFVEEPLYQALNLFDVTPAAWEAVLVATIGLVGMGLWLFTRGRQPLLYAGIALALVPLSYLPNLVLTDTWPPLRTQSALSGLVALYACLGAIGLWMFVDQRVRTGLNHSEARAWGLAPWAVAIAVVGVSVWAGRTNTSTLGAEPLHAELQLLRAQVRALGPGVPRVTFVFTEWTGGLTDVVVYDELGLPFSARPWGPGPMIQLLLRADHWLTPAYRGPQIDYYRPASTQFPTGQPLIDLRGMRNLR